MIDFKIQRGPHDLIFSEPGVINPRLIIEEGCWYLCEDTAELFLGVLADDGLTLKCINEHSQGETTVDPEVLSALRVEITEIKNSLTDYATEQFVTNAIANHEGLAQVEEVKTKLETEVLPTVNETILPVVQKVESEILPTVQELAEKAATQEWVNKQGFITAHQSLDEYAKKEDLFSKDYNDLKNKPEIPSLEGLATEEFVKDEIAKIDVPAIDTSSLVTTEVFNSTLATKADEVPFTTAKFVTNPMGSFKDGDDIKGLTIAEIFAKLLGLTDKDPGEIPDTPEQPGEDATPEEIVDYLIKTEAHMYSQDESGNLIETPFASNTWTQEEAATQMNGVSTVYHIEDAAGNVIESGYQEATDYNEEAWLTVALPSEIKNVKVKMFDPDVNDWVDMLWKVVPAEEQTMDGYTIWTVPEQYEVTSGDTYRFVIIE